MPTRAQTASYNSITNKGIERYKGKFAERDEIIVIIGPITKMIMPDGNKNEFVGDYGMYWVRSYRKSRGEWILGRFDRSCWWPVNVNKLYGEAKKLAKSVYYVPRGTMTTNGKTVRKDYELRPSRR